ncbi:DNA mismatch repair protein MutS [Polaribacter pacificus]|uniref:DNA mismatch repair protein MutS n=1 Tax=Polaribacter pacificus TaxID=1775173 RepID=A0A917MCX7_9FLAO|nr:DNA mismatch repair protein MutS [Polaribacter pacificus]GGG94304.1 DNA mismatch repair protein MutS [Polaribacter pacificus]
MTTNPTHFYTQEKLALETALASLKKTLSLISVFRLAIFIASSIGIYFFIGNGLIATVIGFVGFVIFAILLVKNSKLQSTKEMLLAKIKINTIELAALEGNFKDLKDGSEFIDPHHFYSNDIDLFGKGSFFQYSNRTATQEGAKAYATILTANTINDITEKQKAIIELAGEAKWRQHFSAIASLVDVKLSAKSILNSIKNYETVLPNFFGNLVKVFSAVSIVLIALVSFNILPFSAIVIWFFMGLFISGSQLKKTNTIYAISGNAKEIFKQYYQLLAAIEEHTFAAKILVKKQEEIQSEKEKASTVFQKFSRILDSFDQRNNIVIAIFGNALFLWDIQNAVKVENWISQYKHTAENWFDVISFFDAQNTLANFSFNHPAFVLPTISNEKRVLDVEQLGHPLLNSSKRIDNDFAIDQEQFFIITGANMAGKSTFLRSLSLTILMANIGLPVCAKKVTYSPIKLITSMRTSDSLADDESYFYSELKRLKFIVDQIASEPYFIILDEILKGTNSKDKAIGSKKFIEKLNKSNSTGIIATHDVSLCVLEEEYTTIKNYYFDAQIKDDELYFDYTLKKGVCTNMNASFLLTKMEII